MTEHVTPGYWENVGGEWVNQPEGPPILVGGVDQWVQPPPEYHTDECPCVRCYTVHTVSNTVSLDEVGEEPKDPELTPEDLKRLEELGG